MRQTKGFKKYGCSSEIHYAISILGTTQKTATVSRRVARDLVSLPELTLAAEMGTIDWGKLREISRKASCDTEAFWLELAGKLTYKQIESLARKTPKEALPGDVFEEPETATTELRCVVSEDVLALLDRVRRLSSLEQGEAVTTARVLEWALASYVTQQKRRTPTHCGSAQEIGRSLMMVSLESLRPTPSVPLITKGPRTNSEASSVYRRLLLRIW
jgi:hypothetical protein